MADKTTKEFTPINTEISKNGVVSLATRPNQPSSYGKGDLSATELKKRFDYLANAIIEEYNDLIKVLNSEEILGYLKAHSGSLKSALEQITNKSGDLITKNPEDPKADNEVLNDRILKFYNAIVELQAFTEVKDEKHKEKTLSKVYETIANVDLFKKAVAEDKEENGKEHEAMSELISALQEFLGLNEKEEGDDSDSPLDGVIKGHISDHNNPESNAHSDIRQSVEKAQELANEYTNDKLIEHNSNAEAHTSIRESVIAVSDDLSSHKTASDAHKDVIDATLKSAKDYTNSEVAKYIPLSAKGASNGVATLSSDGKVPAAQLPSFVDDVLEYAESTKFPTSGETGKIYVDLKTNKTYRWSGSKYVEISESLALGETSSTAYRGDFGAKAYAHSQITQGNPHGIDAGTVGLGNVVNTGDSAKPEENGTTKFTTGGAYALKTDLESEIATKVTAETGKGLSSNDFTKDLKDKLESLPTGGASIDEKFVEIGDQVTAKGDYSAAFNKGLIGTETVFETEYSGQTITVSLKDTFTKGVSVEAIDVDKNTIDIYGKCEVSWHGIPISLDLAYAFSKISGEKFNFVIEISAGDIKAYYPAIAVEEVKTNNKTCARLTIHQSCSVSGISTLDKVTNMYGGFAYEDGSMTVNSRNIAWGDSSFASGNGNASIAPNSHTQNYGNVVSGTSGSAAGSMTEAGENAYSTGYLTKALGESSLTFGIKSETAYTESKEKEGGKGSVSGGYDTRANVRYSQAFGVETHSDAVGQLVCGHKNATDPDALFIVGAGNGKNLLSVGKQKSKLTSSLAIGTDGTTASGLNGAVATGDRTLSKGQSSFTFGLKSETAETTYGDNPAEGGKGSIAGGYEAKANAPYSATFGYETRTDRQGQLTCGEFSKEDTEAMFIVGAGTYGAPDNAFKVNADGAGYFKGDVYAAGLKLVSQLDVNKSIANQPVATTTNAGLMTPLDKQKLNAAYDAGHVDLTQYYTKDEVDGKIDGITIPESPISQGAGTGAAYMGDRTSANANYSFSGGETSSTATGAKACLAFGISAEARANGSSAFGYRTIANSDSMTVVGRCNDYSKLGAALFVVGNGTSDTDRANAFYVHSNGNTYINGDLYYKNRKAYTELTEIQGQLMIQMTGYRFVVSFSFILNQRVDSITNWSQLRSYIDSRGWLNLSGWGVDQYSVNLVPLRLRKISSGWVIDVVYDSYGYMDTLPPEIQISIQDSYVKSCSVHCYPL